MIFYNIIGVSGWYNFGRKW